MLDLEALWWKYAGAKAARIREQFDMTESRYYQLLNALLDRPEATRYAPTTVARLRRLREARQGARGNDRVDAGSGAALATDRNGPPHPD